MRLLSWCSDECMGDKPGKGKTVRGNFTHLSNVRRMWAKEKLGKAAESVVKLDRQTATRTDLVEGLTQTSKLMERLFVALQAKPGRWTLPLFLAYSVAHEENHRSQILTALRINGHEPERSEMELWDWPNICKAMRLS